MENFNNLFSEGAMSLDMFEDKKSSGSLDFYRPRYQEGKNGQYTAIIRFVPWYKDPNNSIIRKYEYYLKDPQEGDATVHYNSPVTVKEELAEGQMTNCIVQNVWSALYNSENAAEKQLAQKFSRSTKPAKYALVLILNDPQKPENEGKIKIFRLPDAIWKKFQSKATKSDFDPAINPLEFIGGLSMKLIVGKKDEYNDYSASEFTGMQTNFPLPNDKGEFQWNDESKRFVEMESGNKDHYQRVFKYLEENSPDFDQVAYKDPDEETLARVRRIIRYELSGVNAEQIANKILGENLHSNTQGSMSPNIHPIEDESSDDSLDDDLKDYINEVSDENVSKTETVGATQAEEEDLLGGI